MKIFSKLPIEICEQILEYTNIYTLQQIALVNKQYNRIFEYVKDSVAFSIFRNELLYDMILVYDSFYDYKITYNTYIRLTNKYSSICNILLHDHITSDSNNPICWNARISAVIELLNDDNLDILKFILNIPSELNTPIVDHIKIITRDFICIKSKTKELECFLSKIVLVGQPEKLKRLDILQDLLLSINNYDIFKFLIKTNLVDPSIDDNIMFIRAAAGNMKIVKELLSLPKEYGIDPASQDNTAIMVAASSNNYRIVKLLLELPSHYGIDPSVADNEVFMLAVRNNNIKLVKLLLSLDRTRGINPSAQNNHALDAAIHRGNSKMVKLLLRLHISAGIDPSFNNNQCIINVCNKEENPSMIRILKFLLRLPYSRGVNPSAQNNIALRNALRNCSFEYVKLLLAQPAFRGVDISAIDIGSLMTNTNKDAFMRFILSEKRIRLGDHNNSILLNAVKCNHFDFVKKLLDMPPESGVDPTARDNKALKLALKNNHRNVYDILIKNQEVAKYILTQDSNNFAAAVSNGWRDVVEIMIKSDIEVNDNSVLINAIDHGWIDIVDLLLNSPTIKGLDPAADDNKALILACEKGEGRILYLLCNLPLERGVNPAARNNKALITAVNKDYYYIVKFLLELPLSRGIDPAIGNNKVLISAVKNNHYEIVKLLVELPPKRCVYLAARNNEAFMTAVIKGHVKIIELLLDQPNERAIWISEINCLIANNVFTKIERKTLSKFRKYGIILD